ncbi:MAG TPA: ABC-2 transporter permease [Bacillota bacterium]|nr:ABC-2 transporter permease [Bacillota bacterium]
MQSTMVIIKKELRQNGVILGIPYLILIAIGLSNHREWLSPEWLEILAVAFPVALAGAYGLQAFDSEENTNTRDFLLTKPIQINEIVRPKYLLGLSALLLFTFLWQFILLPQSILLPDLFDLKSLWFSAFILIITTIYNISFITGLMVQGPKKLLIALLCGFIAAGWVFCGWCELATTLYRFEWSFRFDWLSLMIILTATISLATIISLTGKNLTCWLLSKYPFELFSKKVYRYIAVILLFPVCFWLTNQLQKPVIQPFNSLAASFFKLESWFVAVRGFKQPQRHGYAFIDSNGRIALTKSNTQAKPEVVINPPTQTKTNRITWAPDGNYFTFDQDGVIYAYKMARGTTTRILPGETAYWSEDNQQILVGEVVDTRTFQDNGLTTPAQTIKFSVFDRSLNTVVYWAQINSILANALEWDSAREQLLALDRSWSLKLIHLKTGQVQTINFLDSLKEYEIITRSQIIHSQTKPSAYDLVICSRDKESVSKQINRLNLRWYTFNPLKKQIKLQTTFKNVPANQIDLIMDPEHNRLLSNNGSGIYHAKRTGQEVRTP